MGNSDSAWRPHTPVEKRDAAHLAWLEKMVRELGTPADLRAEKAEGARLDALASADRASDSAGSNRATAGASLLGDMLTPGDKRDASHLAREKANIEERPETQRSSEHANGSPEGSLHAEGMHAASATAASHSQAPAEPAQWEPGTQSDQALRFAETHDRKDAALLSKLRTQLHHLTEEQNQLAASHYVEMVPSRVQSLMNGGRVGAEERNGRARAHSAHLCFLPSEL